MTRFYIIVGVVFLAVQSFSWQKLEARQIYNYETGKLENNKFSKQNGSLGKQSETPGRYNKTQNGGPKFYAGNWSLTLGGALYLAPKYAGDNSYKLKLAPVVLLDKFGGSVEFRGHNDSSSWALFEYGALQIGLAGKILSDRSDYVSRDLQGLDNIKWGGEVGGFANFYPTDWLRFRGELRRGIRTHHAMTADLSADIFRNITDRIQLSFGPRAFFATKNYFKTYYGVDHGQSLRSGLRQFDAYSGWGAVGFGSGVTFRLTDKIDSSVFTEYQRLIGAAGHSSLVQQRGNKNQLAVGALLSYRFDFTVK